ncbi:hypothetical protein ACG7TL_005772 [Trametes sanguinea]
MPSTIIVTVTTVRDGREEPQGGAARPRACPGRLSSQWALRINIISMPIADPTLAPSQAHLVPSHPNYTSPEASRVRAGHQARTHGSQRRSMAPSPSSPTFTGRT